MQNYTKIKEERDHTKKGQEDNEIRVTSDRFLRKYLNIAEEKLKDENIKELVIRGTGNAIVNAVGLAELLKRRNEGLHQISEIHSMEIIDRYEPKIEGLDIIEQKRRVTAVKITLSKNVLDTTNVGYQEPLTKEEQEELKEQPY